MIAVFSELEKGYSYDMQKRFLKSEHLWSANEPTQNITIILLYVPVELKYVLCYNFSHIPLETKVTFLELYAVVHYKNTLITIVS